VARTLVFLHAHPDDEALLTAGTMARATAEGQRVVLGMATSGEAGLAASTWADDLGARRRSELDASARTLGIHRVVHLGHRDSGLRGECEGFAAVDPDVIATDVVRVLDEERADILVGYDESGGYGHPDHLQVHRVARRAARRAAHRPRLFEATLPREPIVAAVRIASLARLTPTDFDPSEFAKAWTPRADITHRVDVRAHLDAKRASISAHASQASADADARRTLGTLLRLPRPLFGALLGTEYYRRVD
jgi:LmbE family N-acetylglucosaminyl deacetylase